MKKKFFHIIHVDFSRESIVPGVTFIFFVFLFLLWLAIIYSNKIPFNFSSVLSIHKNNPALWITELMLVIPLLAVYFSYKYLNRIKKECDDHVSSLRKSTDIFTDYMKSITKKDYDYQIPLMEMDNEVGKAMSRLLNKLKSSERKEKDQNWIMDGKEMISVILRSYSDLDELAFQVLKTLVEYTRTVQGAVYLYDEERKILVNYAAYAYSRRKYLKSEFRIGEGLVGMCAYEMDYIYRTEIPDYYFTITSGLLGDTRPGALLLVPLSSGEKLQGVIELASLNNKIPKTTIQFLHELGEIIGQTINNLKINRKTSLLLTESLKLTEELQASELKLKANAEEMKFTQEQLKRSNEQLETKIMELQNVQGKLYHLLENASEVISIYTGDARMTYVSPSVSYILDYTPQEMMEGKDMERLTIKDARSFRQLIENAVVDPYQLQMIQYPFIKKNGEKIYLESTAKNFLDDPAINGIIVYTRDITEKMNAEKEERLKTRMQSLSENSLDIIIRLSTSGQFHYANPVMEDYTGIHPSDLINKNHSEADFAPVLKEYFSDQLHVIKTKPQKTNHEISLPVKMGEKLTERILSLDAIPEFANNELETVLFVGHDITEVKRIAKEIQIKNKNIEDSINYAVRIQSSLLPTEKHIKNHFQKSFVFFRPRDVVSGDFPWFRVNKDYTYLAVVDCTGHGVPGALLSFIGYFLLNNIVDKVQEESSAEICDQLHTRVRYTLRQTSEKPDTQDGMDLAFCKINNSDNSIQFTGAHRPLYHLSKGELTEYKGDHKSIGGMTPDKKAGEKFTDQLIKINKGDKIFMFSDGLTDQLGGPYGRKYSSKRLIENILLNPGSSMNQYKELIENDFLNWKKDFKQMDDILMIGIEF